MNFSILSFAILFSVFTMSCGSQGTPDSRTSTSSAFEGGISGGGGNANNADPATVEDITREANQSRGQLIQALNYLSGSGPYIGSGPKNLEAKMHAKLFASQRSMLSVIREVGISIETNRPCYEKNGDPRDGSIYGATPNTICISASRLAKKLNQDNVRVQTLALIAHEYSHLVGTTEPEAEAIQTVVSRILAKTSHAELMENSVELSSGSFRAWYGLTELRKSLDQLTPTQLNDRSLEVDNLVLEIYIYRPHSEVSILSHSQLIFLDQLMREVFEMRYTLEDRVKVKAVIDRAIRNTDILLRDAQNTADLMR